MSRIEKQSMICFMLAKAMALNSDSTAAAAPRFGIRRAVAP
jgi:hypothetical protein